MLVLVVVLQWPKFPFGPWVSKNRLNWLKKFMQVEIHVKCMQKNFGGCGFSIFGDFTPFQKQLNFSFGSWTINTGGLQSMGVKKQNQLKKFMQIARGGCEINFGGCDFSSFVDLAYFSFAFKMAKISFRAMGLQLIGSKNRIGSKNSHKQRWL